MKKIFVLLTSAFLFFATNVNAKVITTEEDYQTEEEKEIITEDELLEGYNYFHEHNEIIDFEKIIVNKIEYLNNDEFIILGGIKEGVKVYPYACYYKNNDLVFQKIYTELQEGEFSDFTILEDRIAIIGSVKNSFNCYGIIIMEISFKGDILKKQTLNSDRDSYGYKIMNVGNFYYFVGKTYASSFEGVNSEGSTSLIYGNILKNNFNKYDVMLLGNSGGIIYHDSICISNEIYILATSYGKGYFTSNNEDEFLMLIKTDYQLGQPIYISLKKEEASKKYKMTEYSGNLLLASQQSDYLIKFDLFDLELNKIKSFNYEDLDLPSRIKDYYLTTNGEYIGLSVVSDESHGTVILKFDERIYYEYNKKSSDFQLINFQYKNHILNYYTFENGKHHLFNKFFLRKINENIFVNGIHLAKEKVLDGDNEFGEEFVDYKIEFDNIVVYYKERLIVPLKVNIENFGIYDQGIVLEFNGKGYLNGVEIKSGYKITKEDKYLLELYSNNQNKESFYFTVSDLTEDIEEKEFIRNYELELEKINEKNESTFVMFANDLIIEPIKEEYDYFYIILFLFLGMTFGKIFIRRKKNV